MSQTKDDFLSVGWFHDEPSALFKFGHFMKKI